MKNKKIKLFDWAFTVLKLLKLNIEVDCQKYQ